MSNLEKIIANITELSLDAVMIHSEVNRRYASNDPTSEGVALIGRGFSYYLTDSRYMEAAVLGMPDFKVLKTDGNKVSDMLNAIIGEKGIKTLGFEEDIVTVSQFEALQKEINCQLKPGQKAFNKARASKLDWEKQIMRESQAIADKTFTELLGIITEGMSEHELATEIIYRLMRNGAEGISFPPIAVAGPNTSKPHGIPGHRKLQKGDFITMDFGCVHKGYCSDMTRTVALGSATAEMEEVYYTVLNAQLQGIAAAKAGVTGKDIDAAARQYISNAGYGEYFEHGFGHSLGLEIHEAPNANTKNEDPMPAGAVISAEPGIYMAGKFGVRIEDVLILNEDGNENITASPKMELIVI